MQIITSSLLIAILLLMLSGCQKEEAPQLDLAAPVINIVAPSTAESYGAGQEVLLYVEFSENQELHDYSIVIRNEDRSYSKTLAEGHAHDRTHVVEMEFVLPDEHDQTYTITVKATDHNDNLASQQVVLIVL